MSGSFIQKPVVCIFSTVNRVFPRSSEKAEARNALGTDVTLRRLLLLLCSNLAVDNLSPSLSRMSVLCRDWMRCCGRKMWGTAPSPSWAHAGTPDSRALGQWSTGFLAEGPSGCLRQLAVPRLCFFHFLQITETSSNLRNNCFHYKK